MSQNLSPAAVVIGNLSVKTGFTVLTSIPIEIRFFKSFLFLLHP